MPRRKVDIEDIKEEPVKAKPAKASEPVVVQEELVNKEIPWGNKEEYPEPTQEPLAEEKGKVITVTYKTNRSGVNNDKMQHESVELTSTVGVNESEEDVFNYLRETAEYLLDD